MKAVFFRNYGSPDVITVEDTEKPTPTDDQILIKIHSCAINPLDWHRMRGEPFLVKIDEGFKAPKNPRLGADIAGVVEAVGKNVTSFTAGDEVIGEIGAGGLAEYVCVTEKYLTHKPSNVSFEEAAAVPVTGLTAIQGMRDTGKIKAGQHVLINGASGGIGTFAVQYAKHLGCEVTGVCSTRNLEMVKSIGADHVIDYTTDDFTKQGEKYDLIYDTVGNKSAVSLRRALKPNGIASIAGFTTFRMLLDGLLMGALLSKMGSKTVANMGVAEVVPEDMKLIADLLENGAVKPVIDRTYPLEESAEAIRYLETMRARGKVIVQI